MIIEVVGKEIEKIKGDFESYLNGLNMVGEISYSQYSELYDEGTKQIQKAYELGKSEFEKENTELKKGLRDANEKVVHLACNQNKDLKYKLTKAKFLLKQLVDAFPKSYSDVVKDTLKQAEQFIKDSEVEK